MNTQRWQSNWDKISIFTAIVPLTVGMAFMTATTAPVSAQSVIVIEQGTSLGVSQPPPTAGFVYGSPIPTPMPVNPATGLMPPRPTYYSYPVYPVRSNLRNSTLINPILVNPRVRDSTLINPVIVNDRGHGIPVLRLAPNIFPYP